MEIEYLYIDNKVLCYVAFAWAVAIMVKALLKYTGDNKKGKK